MLPYQKEFIDLAIKHNALRFGQFTLKSGRKSPYFFNCGHFHCGSALKTLGQCYAQTINDAKIEFDLLFGPAYKGITLASSTAIAFSQVYKKGVRFAFNRKEIKEHGEGGQLIGAPLKGKVIIIDDVITAGTAIKEAISLIHQTGAQIGGIVVALDRQERGSGEKSAIQEIQDKFQIPILSIIKLSQVIEFVSNNNDKELLLAMKNYQQTYGI